MTNEQQDSHENTWTLSGHINDGPKVALDITITWPKGRSSDAARLINDAAKSGHFAEMAKEMLMIALLEGEKELQQSLAVFQAGIDHAESEASK